MQILFQIESVSLPQREKRLLQSVTNITEWRGYGKVTHNKYRPAFIIYNVYILKVWHIFLKVHVLNILL